ncbi:MAG: riboflavin biosynthesis protein RibF, partial [Desulfobacteraceae bacterium]
MPIHKAVVTIGNFDGVHIGHQALLQTVVEKAHRIGGTAVALT